MGLASFKSLLASASKFVDKAKALAPRPGRRKGRVLQVTGKRGKKRTPYNHIIKIDTSPILHRQIGIKWKNGECLPFMEAYREIRVLHATKGWRTYTNRVPGIGKVA